MWENNEIYHREFSVRLAKSLQLGYNSKLSIEDVNKFLGQAIDRPNEVVLIKFESKKHHRTDRRYDLTFVIVKAILFYNKQLDFNIRVRFLEGLLRRRNLRQDMSMMFNDKTISIKFWIKVLFADFDNYIQYFPFWEQLLYLFCARQVNKKQVEIPRLIVKQFNKHFRAISKRSRRVLLDKLMRNEDLQRELQKIVFKNNGLILASQARYFYDNLCEEEHKKRMSDFL